MAQLRKKCYMSHHSLTWMIKGLWAYFSKLLVEKLRSVAICGNHDEVMESLEKNLGVELVVRKGDEKPLWYYLIFGFNQKALLAITMLFDYIINYILYQKLWIKCPNIGTFSF